MKISTATKLTRRYINKHKLDREGYTVEVCNILDGAQGRTVFTDRKILLDRTFILASDYTSLKYVVVHEIAHCLTPHDEHGEDWADKVIEVGGYNTDSINHALECFRDRARESQKQWKEH